MFRGEDLERDPKRFSGYIPGWQRYKFVPVREAYPKFVFKQLLRNWSNRATRWSNKESVYFSLRGGAGISLASVPPINVWCTQVQRLNFRPTKGWPPSKPEGRAAELNKSRRTEGSPSLPHHQSRLEATNIWSIWQVSSTPRLASAEIIFKYRTQPLQGPTLSVKCELFGSTRERY